MSSSVSVEKADSSDRYDKKKEFSLKEMITFNIDVPFHGVSVPLAQAQEDSEEDGNEDKNADADAEED